MVDQPAESTAAPDPDAPGTRPLGGLVKHSFIYSLVPAFSRIAGFLMIPFYTSPGWLTPAEYGLADVGDLVLVALSQLLGVNLLSAMVRFYFDRQELRQRQAVVSSCTLSLAVLSWAICGLCILFRGPLAPVLLGREHAGLDQATNLAQFLAIVLLIVPFKLTTMSGLFYLQILKRSRTYSAILLVKTLLELGLKIYTIGFLGWGVRGFMLSVLVGEALTTAGLTSWMLWKIKPRIDFEVLRPILQYTAPLIPVGLCQLALHQLDRRLLEAISPGGFDSVGIYALGYKFGYIVNAMALTPFMQIWQPWIYGVDDPRERASLVARVSTYAVFAISACSLIVILLGRQVVELAAGQEQFELAFKVVPWVAAGYVFWALYFTTQIPLFIAKRTWPLLLINLGALAANIALNLVLVVQLDYLGSAIATLLTFALLAGMGMLASRREAHVPFEYGRLGRILAVVLGAVAVTWIADTAIMELAGQPFYLALPFKLAALYFGGRYLWEKVLEDEERDRILAWLGRVRASLPGVGPGGR